MNNTEDLKFFVHQFGQLMMSVATVKSQNEIIVEMISKDLTKTEKTDLHFKMLRASYEEQLKFLSVLVDKGYLSSEVTKDITLKLIELDANLR